MSELDLDRAVRDLCGRHGIWYHHNRQAKYGEPGWPDLVLIGRRAGLFRELKGDRGTVRDEQRRVGALMTGAGWDWGIWTPADLESGRIAAELAALGSLHQRQGCGSR